MGWETIYDFSAMARQRVERASCELKRLSPALLFQIELQWICADISRAKSLFGALLVGCFSACAWAALECGTWSSVV